MRAREPEIWLWLPLLPIFFLGTLPVLLFGFLGFAGFSILGILMVCVGLSDGLHANCDFNRQVIVHGYARRSERATHASSLHSANHFAAVMKATGAGLIIVGLFGVFHFG
jgi:hypothetical protein